jgi:pyruvate dehydrogenase E1 component
VAPEAEAAFAELVEEEPGAGFVGNYLARPAACGVAGGLSRPAGRGSGGDVTIIETLLAPLARGAALVSVLDGHPVTHAWLGAVCGQRVVPLGPDRFGENGDILDLYWEYGLDTDAILDACAQAMLAVQGGKGGRGCRLAGTWMPM